MSHHSKAFTLIELLVVIAIIAILAAILFPVFAQAKLAAKKATALSNAKQVGTSLAIYVNDYDDATVKAYFGAPAGCDWSQGADHWYTWRSAMQPYAKNVGVLGDSTNTFSTNNFYENQVTGYNNPNPPAEMMPTNFALNDAVAGIANGQCIGTHDTVVTTLTALDNPAGTILVVPSNGRTPTIQWWWGSNVTVEAGNITDGSLWCNVQPGASALLNGGFFAGAQYNCPSFGVSAIHSVSKSVSFVWADTHAKAKAYNATLNPGGVDDWDSKDQIMQNGNFATAADRLLVSQNLYQDLR